MILTRSYVDHGVIVGLIDSGEIPEIALLTKRKLIIGSVAVHDLFSLQINDSFASFVKQGE
jgi:hypothetical protein